MDRVTTAYDESMTSRITVSLPDDLVEDLRKAVAAGRYGSVSAAVSDALRRSLRRDSWRALFDDWDKEFGAPTAEEWAWADAELARTDAEWDAIERGE